MSAQDPSHSQGSSSEGASRSKLGVSAKPAAREERAPRGAEDRPRGGPSSSPRNDRGPRPEGGFGGGDRPRFNSDRGPREERNFGGGDRGPRGPRPEGGDRPRFNKDRSAGGDRSRPNAVREERPDYANNEGEIRRNYSGIRTYRAPADLKGKPAPIKVIRPEEGDEAPKKKW